jgi:membrane protein implicated in regulation of membrane protease activity
MPGSPRFWRVVVSVLLIVLVLATTMGMVWHHHDQCSAGNCTLCHLVIGTAAPVVGAIGLVPVTADYAVLENRFVSRRSTTEKPPRAPPV